MKNTLYRTNTDYLVHKFKNREEWKSFRIKGIGGSDCSAIIGENPYKTNEQLFKEKMRLIEIEEIGDKPAVRYGTIAEEHIRELFRLDYAEKYEVQYQDNTILQSKDDPMFLYSPDGLLLEKQTGRKGILEVKTTTILQSMQKEKWNEQIPQNYYCQILHGLNVTKFSFVVLRALIRYSNNYAIIRDYVFDLDDLNTTVKEDCTYLSDKVREFWNNNIVTKKAPNLIIKL